MNPAPILDETTVAEYVIRRGLFDATSPIGVEALSGGVSSAVLRVRQGDRQFVVKQALPKLLVDDAWFASPRRSLIEAEALDLADRVCPASTPVVVDSDPDVFALVLSNAPADCVNWRDELLTGVVREGAGKKLGAFLASWHSAAGLIPRSSALRDQANLIDLRVSPYYWEIARRHEDLAQIASVAVRRMLDTRVSPVHGDFSPKNILVGEAGPFVLDFEVAHVGDPTFDVAFLLHHLVLKSIKLPTVSERLLILAGEFEAAYRDSGASTGFDDPAYVFTQVALLTLARIDGKSKVLYLNAAQSDRARSVARRMATEPPTSLEGAWRMIQSE